MTHPCCPTAPVSAVKDIQCCRSLVAQACLTLQPHGLWPARPLSMGFSRQEHWSGRHCLLQGIFPTQGLSPRLFHWQVNSFNSEPPGKPNMVNAAFQNLVLCFSLEIKHGWKMKLRWTSFKMANLRVSALRFSVFIIPTVCENRILTDFPYY